MRSILRGITVRVCVNKHILSRESHTRVNDPGAWPWSGTLTGSDKHAAETWKSRNVAIAIQIELWDVAPASLSIKEN